MVAGQSQLVTPLQFEAEHCAEWQEFDRLLLEYRSGNIRQLVNLQAGPAITRLYRRCCEHLSLARGRDYPAYLIERLEQLTADAHQLIYQQRVWGWHELRRLFVRGFPEAVRELGWSLGIAACVLVVPALVMGCWVYFSPEVVNATMDPVTAAQYQQMYDPENTIFGPGRDAGTDWQMFGFYVRNNISVAFRCFAGGLFVGIGSLVSLAFNGLDMGAVAGYLAAHGLSRTFFSFIATHSAFELTAIVLSGAAGLQMGFALLAPGSLPRRTALVNAARHGVVVMYGVVAMLFIAAIIEAFWSSASWLPASAKYFSAAVCWIAVLSYLILQGRHAR